MGRYGVLHMVPPELKREWPRLAVLGALALATRLAYLGSTSPDAAIGTVDAWGYHQLALNLDQGNGFSLRRDSPFVPDSVRTPLYPLFLFAIRRGLGPSPRAAVVAQALLEVGTTLLTWSLATRVAGRPSGRVAALLYALSATQIRFAAELLTETLLSFILTLAALALVHYLSESSESGDTMACRRSGMSPGSDSNTALLIAAVGTLSGLAALCKPNVQFLPIIWLFIIATAQKACWKRTLQHTAWMGLGVLLVWTPWLVRNRIVFGRWFLSTAFEGNISRVSAPAAMLEARGEYAPPWSDQWEAAFGEIVTETALRYGWDRPWDALPTRELDIANRQVSKTARALLIRHPSAWLRSHILGLARYLEPQTYRVCYARFTKQEWPPDILDDAVLHVLRAIANGDLAQAGQIIAQERWSKLSTLQGLTWWGTLAGQLLGSGLALRGAWRLRTKPALAGALLLTIGYVLWLPGPIAYERFRVPVFSLVASLIGTSVALPRAST